MKSIWRVLLKTTNRRKGSCSCCLAAAGFGTTVLFLVGLVLPVYGHQQTAPWLDESSLDRGLHIEVRHPRAIRNPGPFGVSVVLSNLMGDGDFPGDPFTGTLIFEDLLQPPDKFVVIIAARVCAACPTDPVPLAIANPIWLEF